MRLERSSDLHLIHRMPLALKGIILTLFVSTLVWFLLDSYQNRALREVFEGHLHEMLSWYAQHDRLELHQMISGFQHSATLLSESSVFLRIVDRHLTAHRRDDPDRESDPSNTVIAQVEHDHAESLSHKHNEAVNNQAIVQYTIGNHRLQPRYVILVDQTLNTVTPLLNRQPLPSSLATVNPFLIRKSREQGHIMELDGVPYLFSSTPLRSPSGHSAHLVLAKPIDDEFLQFLGRQTPRSNREMVLLKGPSDASMILATSNASVIESGQPLHNITGDYLVTRIELFEYGTSDLSVTFASLLSKMEMEQTTDYVLEKERRARFITEASSIFAFLLILLWLTQKIRSLNRRIAAFVIQELGDPLPPSKAKDQLIVLEERFQEMTQKVKSAHKTLVDSSNEIREKESWLQSILDHVNEGILVLDTNATIITANPVCETLFGYESTALPGLNLSHLLCKEITCGRCFKKGSETCLADHPVSISDLMERVSDGSGLTMECLGRQADAHMFPLELAINAMLFNGRKAYIAITRDITERQKLAVTRERDRSEQLFRLTLENINLAALLLEPQGTITFCNDFLLDRLDQHHRTDLIGQPWTALFDDDEAHETVQELLSVAMIQPTVEACMTWKFMQEMHQTDGSLRTMIWYVTRLHDQGGAPLSHAFIGEDITDRLKVENALRVAKEQAEHANTSKTRFLANLSHEIRTPLNAIIGFTRILMNHRDAIPKEYATYLDHINTSGDTLSELINNILDLSRIESGRMTVNPEAIRLTLIIQSIYHINKVAAMRKGLDYSYSIDPDLPATVISDRTLLNQILMNLSSNAVKFTPEGKAVRIACEYRQEEDSYQITISDQGIGIAEQRQKTIFEPFQQAESNIRSRFGGTGLGLALVKQSVAFLQGEIAVESRIGSGTTFTITLPINPPFAVDLEAGDSSEEREHGPGSMQQTLPQFDAKSTVLIIEDDPMSLTMIVALLKDFGVRRLETAENGAIGVQHFEKAKPDLILMDMEMPVMDGFETIRKVRSSHVGNRNTPLIALSADAFTDQKKRALSAGADYYLTKPIDFCKLLEVLKKYLPLVSENVHNENVVSQNAASEGRDNAEELNTVSSREYEMIQMYLKALNETALYQSERIVALSRELQQLTQNNNNELHSVFKEIEEMVFSRNSKRIPDLITRAIQISEESHGPNSRGG
ncbi:MAG: response regulator [Magnetococcales bacterium]|nr:response regulator [Magnetococcales bacterium]